MPSQHRNIFPCAISGNYRLKPLKSSMSTFYSNIFIFIVIYTYILITFTIILIIIDSYNLSSEILLYACYILI